MSTLRRLLREIHTRSVWQVLATYVGVSWLVLEAAEHIIGQWGLPEEAYPIALLLLLVGLPFIVATAWLQDEPWARKRASESPPDTAGPDTPRAPVLSMSPLATAARRIFTWRNAGWGGLSVLVIWGALWMGSALRGTPAAGGNLSFASAWPSAERTYGASLFVSVLRDLSADQTQGHAAEGITEELIHALSHLEGLRVPSFTSSVALRGQSLRPPEIGELLDVDHLIEGTLSTEGDSIRIILQLIDCDTDAHEWSLDFSGSLGDVFGLRERIASAVSDSVAAHLPVGEPRREVRLLSESPAHEAYLDGRESLGRRTPTGIRDAIATLHGAIALDSAYAPAIAALSSAYALSVTYRTDLPVNAYTAAGYSLRLANRAAGLDPDLAAAFAARGYVSSVSFAPVEVILPDFRRAMELEPDAPQVPGWYAHLLVREGRIEEALEAARRSARLSPLAPGRRIGLAYEALHAREYALAVEEGRAATALEPAQRLSAALTGRALYLSGRIDECLALDLGPYVGTRALCLWAAGRADQAEAVVSALRQRVEGGAYAEPGYSVALPTEDLTVYYAGTGQAALTLEWLQRTFSLSPSGVDSRTIESGLFDDVLETPGFREELGRLREAAWTRVQRLADVDQALPAPAP